MLTVDSSLENIPLISHYVKETAKNFFSEVQLLEIEQAISEAVNNCIEHAYEYSDRHSITLNCTMLDNGLLIEMCDQGKPFDIRCLEDVNTEFDFDPIDIENLPEGGLGLKIIKTYMDNVGYRRENSKNYWYFTKYSTSMT